VIDLHAQVLFPPSIYTPDETFVLWLSDLSDFQDDEKYTIQEIPPPPIPKQKWEIVFHELLSHAVCIALEQKMVIGTFQLPDRFVHNGLLYPEHHDENILLPRSFHLCQLYMLGQIRLNVPVGSPTGRFPLIQVLKNWRKKPFLGAVMPIGNRQKMDIFECSSSTLSQFNQYQRRVIIFQIPSFSQAVDPICKSGYVFCILDFLDHFNKFQLIRLRIPHDPGRYSI